MWSVNGHNLNNLWDQVGRSIGSVLWLPGQHPFDIYGAIPRESPGQLSNYEWWGSSTMWWRQLGSSSHFPQIPPNKNTPLFPYGISLGMIVHLTGKLGQSRLFWNHQPMIYDWFCAVPHKKWFPDGPVARRYRLQPMWCFFRRCFTFSLRPAKSPKIQWFLLFCPKNPMISRFFLTKQFHFQTG